MGIFVHVRPDNQILDPSSLEVKRDGNQRQHSRLKKSTWCLRHLDVRLALPAFFGHNSYLSSVFPLTHLQQSAQTFEDGTSADSTLSQHITSCWEKRKNRACSPGVSRALIAQSMVRRRPRGFVRRWLGPRLQLCAGAKTKTRPTTRFLKSKNPISGHN